MANSRLHGTFVLNILRLVGEVVKNAANSRAVARRDIQGAANESLVRLATWRRAWSPARCP